MRKLIYIAIALCISLSLASIQAQQTKIPADQKLRIAERIIADYYVDTVDETKLVETALRSMLEELDPHSSYSDAEETKELNEPLTGNFSGIGITFNINKDTVYVIQTVAGGPSERVGLLAGDRIIAVNDSAIAGMKLKQNEIKKRLRGPKGSKVDLKVLRRSGSASDTIPFRITRDDIPIFSIDASYMTDPETGFIRISRFAAETPKEFAEAVGELKKKGMKRLILDLTDNGGGFLNAAVEILGEILEPGQMTVYTEGRESPRHDFKARPAGKSPLLKDIPVAVMINQYTASAAEITSGAIQDWDRGVVVGRRSFGKGLVQRPFPFPDGTMMRLTIAHYYTPTGRDIQRPYTKGDAGGYRKDLLDRFHSGELMHADSIKYIDSLKVSTLRLGRNIYGGGGISPDRFVPLDTTQFTKYFRDVTAKGAINSYVISYVEANRKALKKNFKNSDAFAADFVVTEDMLADLYDLAAKEGVEPNSEQAEISKELFTMNIKGLIARDIYDQAAFYKVYNRYDPIFQEAMEAIKPDNYDNILNKSH